METNIVNFIKKYYTLEVNGDKEIFLRDIFEDNEEISLSVDINSKVKFIWGRAKNITGVDLRNKEYTHIQKIIREIFRSKQSLDFYKFMINEIRDIEFGKGNKGLVIPLKDVQHEFPNLYGDNVIKIIAENKKNDGIS